MLPSHHKYRLPAVFFLVGSWIGDDQAFDSALAESLAHCYFSHNISVSGYFIGEVFIKFLGGVWIGVGYIYFVILE